MIKKEIQMAHIHFPLNVAFNFNTVGDQRWLVVILLMIRLLRHMHSKPDEIS